MRIPALIAYVLTATSAMAHGGHEEARSMGVLHWFASAGHLLTLALGACVFALAVYIGFRVARLTRALS